MDGSPDCHVICMLYMQWGCAEWDGLYMELPCRQLKVKVQDRMSIKTADFARTCVEPVGLQAELDQLVGATLQGRAFVRYLQGGLVVCVWLPGTV